MNIHTAKIVFIYTSVAVFISFALIAILGAVGVLQIGPVTSAVAIASPCAGIVAAVVNAKHLFEDSEAIRELKEEQHDMILAMKKAHSDEVADLQKAIEKLEREIMREAAQRSLKSKR